MGKWSDETKRRVRLIRSVNRPPTRKWWSLQEWFDSVRANYRWWLIFLSLWQGDLKIRAAKKKEWSRASALRAYHARGKAKREARWDAAARNPINLEKAFRRILARRPKATVLQRAAESVVKKYNRRVRAHLVRALRRRLENATARMKLGGKSEKAREWLGCSLEDFRKHLEGRFKPGMTWENHGYKGWHIDHIKPIVSFDLWDPAQLRACFHYSNLQPLWHDENFAKGKKILECEPGPGCAIVLA